MSRWLLAAFLLASAGALHAKDPGLVGLWTLDGAPYAEFKADGTCWVSRMKGKWKAGDKALILSYDNGAREVMEYELAGSSLIVAMKGQSKTLVRGRIAAGAGPDAAVSISALLMSAPWCYASRDEITGKTRRERISFRGGGLWFLGRADADRSGFWQMRGDRLWMSRNQEPMQDAGILVSRDANGYPIVRIGKKEYSQCR